MEAFSRGFCEIATSASRTPARAFDMARKVL
jgi:hypothetical protein